MSKDASTALIAKKDAYGFYLTHSHLCNVCNAKNHMEINLLRARDHLSYKEIVTRLKQPGISEDILKKHFTHHYIISTSQSKILSLTEEGSSEALAIVTKIFEGNLDVFTAGHAILESKAGRLQPITSRIQFLSAHLEDDSADDTDKQEYIQLNRIATDIEDSMAKIYFAMTKNLFPASKEEMSNAILRYKLEILSKIIDQIQFILLELENDPVMGILVQRIRFELAQKIGSIEDEIIKAGGIIKSAPASEKKEEVEDTIEEIEYQEEKE